MSVAPTSSAPAYAYADLHALIRKVVRRYVLPHLPADAEHEPSPAPTSLSAAAAARGVRPLRLSLCGVPARSARAHPSAKERRASIARARQLRGDIMEFEEGFRAKQGRDPKTASERFEASHVYDEYRRLKASIRDDAAKHIQCLFRGYVVRVAQARLRAAGGAGTGASEGAGVGGGAHGSSGGLSSTAAVAAQPFSDGAGVGGAGALAPSRPAVSISPAPSAAVVALSKLRDEKALLKRSLRAFDVAFAAAHGGCAPSKADKEHLRSQYARYHELKGALEVAEAAVARDAAATAAAGVGSAPALLAAAAARSSAQQGGLGDVARRLVLSADADEDPAGGSLGDSVVVGAQSSGTADAAAAAIIGLGSAAALREEKKRVQAFLRQYEKDFLERNGRAVKFVKDIEPVVDSYKRYKALKAAFAKLQADE